MKKTTLLLLAIYASILPVFADVVVVQEVDAGGGQKMQVPMKLKGDKIRIDMEAQKGSTIMDTGTGNVIMLMHPQKSYMLVSGETIKSMNQQVKADKPDASPAKPQPTGRKQKINAYDTEEYVLKTKDGQISLWLAKNVPNQELLLQQFKKLNNSTGGGNAELDYSALPGFPIRMEISGKAGKTNVTILSIQEVTLPDSDFKPPADYKQMEAPPAPPIER
ncbi:MAG: DUF4412 domain-containing protein [Chthoniobacterales bacterium]